MSDAAPPKATRREWIGLAFIALPCLLYSMDLTVLNLALPALAADLAPSNVQMLWIVDIYGFFIAGALMTMGTLGDRIGRRRLLMIGAAVFGAASVAAAFSTSAEMLIATRAVLGVAGATLAPSTLSLIRNMFQDPQERTFAVGIWVTSFSVGAAVGPVAGGILLEFFWWGSVFLIAVPVMLLLLALAPMLLPEYRDPSAGRLDLASSALSLLAVLSLIYGLKDAAQHGAGWPAAASLLVAAVAAALFVRRQRTLADPFIDLGLFRAPAFSAALLIYTLGTFVGFGVYVFVIQYLQGVLGMPALAAGLWSVPFMLGFVLGSIVSPRLVRFWRPAQVMTGGLLIAAIGYVLMTQTGRLSGPGILVAGMVLQSIGLAPVFTLANDLIISTAPAERAGAAAGISETCSELGGALGIALLGTLATAVYGNAFASETLPRALALVAAICAAITLAMATLIFTLLRPAPGKRVPTPQAPSRS